MANENVLSGLIRKRAEITAQVEALQMQLRQLIMDADNLDGSIRLFDPDIDLTDIRPRSVPRQHVAFEGEVKRTTLNALRETGLALTIKDVALRVMAERKLNGSDARLVRVVEKKVGSCLRNLRSRGIVQSEKLRGSYLRWVLADGDGVA
jgi:hypothetical protein